MNALDKINEKLLNEMSEIEQAIWYTYNGTTAYDMEKAAAELAALKAERDELKKILKEIEYSADIDGYPACPICLNDEYDTHKDDCRLMLILTGNGGG
jgi:hypothetical protein